MLVTVATEDETLATDALLYKDNKGRPSSSTDGIRISIDCGRPGTSKIFRFFDDRPIRTCDSDFVRDRPRRSPATGFGDLEAELLAVFNGLSGWTTRKFRRPSTEEDLKEPNGSTEFLVDDFMERGSDIERFRVNELSDFWRITSSVGVVTFHRSLDFDLDNRKTDLSE